MDCHLEGTAYKPLGYFRQANPVEFISLLAKHQGSCALSDGQINAMTNAIAWLPQGCTLSTTALSDGSYLYYDFKPTTGGGVEVALYADESCSVEYSGSEYNIAAVLNAQYGYDVNYEQDLASLNTALDAFKVCTPCRTYKLSSMTSSNADANSNGDDANQNGNADNGDPNNLNFVCEDDAGDAGINQCMAFAQNTEIYKASFSELAAASQQRTITRTYGAAELSQTWWQAWGFFTLCSRLAVFLCCRRQAQARLVGEQERAASSSATIVVRELLLLSLVNCSINTI
jgi:hypothetical protein